MVMTRDSRKRLVVELSQGNLDESGGGTSGNRPFAGTSNDTATSSAMDTTSTSTVPPTLISRAAVDKDGFFSLTQEVHLPKKRKYRPKPMSKQIKPPLEDLPTEVLENILGFVEDIPDLFCLVNTVKAFRNAIIPRPDIVVRTAVYGGGSSKKAIESFFDDIRYHRIHIPSTLRLLRVLSGTRCERGTDCLQYHLIQKRSCKLLPDNLRHFGIALCSTCFCDLTHNTAKGHHKFVRESYLNHERLAVAKVNRQHLMLLRPLEDKGTQEATGSLIPSYKVAQVANTYFTNRRGDMSEQEAHVGAERMLISFANDAADEGRRTVEELAAETVGRSSQLHIEKAAKMDLLHSSATVVAYPDNTVRREEIVDAYDKAQSGYDTYKKAKKALLLAHKPSSNREQKKKYRVKRQNGKRVLATISDMMALSAFTMGAHYQDEFSWLFDCSFDTKGYGRFKTKIVDEILGPVVRAPTTGSIEKLTNAIETLLQKLEILEACGFLEDWPQSGIGFLNSQCPCEKAVEEYCRRFIPPSDLLSRKLSGIKNKFFSDIEHGHFKEALYLGIHRGNTLREYGTDLYWMFAGSVAKEYVSHHDDSFSNYLLLSTKIWESPIYGFTKMWNFISFKKTFLALRERYRAYIENIRTYFMLELTTKFLEETGAPLHRPDQVFTRQDAVDSVWTMNPAVKLHLDSHKYDELLQLHQNMFDNPRKFGLNPYERH